MQDGDLQLRIRPSTVVNSTIISLQGPLTMHQVSRFQEAWRETTNDLIFHLAEVPAIDSSGIGSLVNALVSCRKSGRRLALVEVPRRLHNMLSAMRVDALFAMYPNIEQAEKAFSARATPGA